MRLPGDDVVDLRLAADTGARRGERWRLTIGATTAAMIRQHFDGWAERAGREMVGDWIFAPDYRRAIHARASLLSHRFVRFRDRAGVPDAALHRSVTPSPPRWSRTARQAALRRRASWRRPRL